MTFLSAHATLIYNPHAGFWDWGGIIEQVVKFWEDRGWTMHVESTAHAGHATELARAAALAEHGMVFAAGGDGTLNEVANGLVHTATVLAPFPVGTGNSLAKELGLARPNLLNQAWMTAVSQALARGHVQRMDLGKCDNGRHWLLWASTGIDSFVVRQIEPRPKWFKRLGSAGYAAKALFFLPQFEGVAASITTDDRTIEDEFLLINVSNCRKFAGGEVRLNRDGVLDDGMFELWLFRGKHWPSVISYAFGIGLGQHGRHPKVDVVRTRYVAVETSPSLDYHLDGEPVARTPFACELLPHALRILAPDTTPQDLFSQPGEPML